MILLSIYCLKNRLEVNSEGMGNKPLNGIDGYESLMQYANKKELGSF
jgi:hypothetical protein